jgi:pyruvate-ferredoxin/flavodoxin oxidoreductase
MAKAVFDELRRPEPTRHFTVGITDDVTHLSLAVDTAFDLDGTRPDVVRAVFFGLGADGTVGANKNSIKIIGEETHNFAQGYFVYDSKKSGAMTVSHLRFGPKPIHAPYLITRAGFVACHQYEFLDTHDILSSADPGAIFLLNAPYGPDEIWDQLPAEVQAVIVERRLRFFVVDAYRVAREAGIGTRINTIMQTCFFAISGVLPREAAILKIKTAIRKTYNKRGEAVVRANCVAVDETLAHLHEVDVPAAMTSARHRPAPVSDRAPAFVQRVTAAMLAGYGDRLPVSAFPVDGAWPTGTAQWEKRNLAASIPAWDEGLCIQCNKCAFVCPHAAIRVKVYAPDRLPDSMPSTFKSVDFKDRDLGTMKYTIQVAPEDCTGCTLCVAVCPAKDKSNPKHKALEMQPQRPLRDAERANYEYFLRLPEIDPAHVKPDVKHTQFLQPLFEYSGACAGCGETPYLKLVTQLFGDHLLIANATGCSSIYGGNLPTTPYAMNRDGRGPSWSNSLFEDNAEFGLGMRLALDQQREEAQQLVRLLAGRGLLASGLADEILSANHAIDGVAAQRQRAAALRAALAMSDDPAAHRLLDIADSLVKKSVWIIGGDGWAYDIGYGGLDHILALNRDVNVLVLDTEVYSNTGGQQSKATPLGAAAKFAVAGKSSPKKDLGLLAMAYGTPYVARVASGAKDTQTVKAFLEAESYPGTSLIIAYSHCIAHGYDLSFGLDQQRRAVECGYWPLYRFDPRRRDANEPALVLDSGPPKLDLGQYVRNEARFRIIEQTHPERFKRLLAAAQADVRRRYAIYEEMAAASAGSHEAPPTAPSPVA